MCFSETASFTAAAVLTVQGLFSLNLVRRKKRFLLLGAIPLFFAVQQFSEGLVWHALNQGKEGFHASFFAASIFLFFAFIFWPIAIAFSLWLVEKIKWRKNILSFCIIASLFWALYLSFSISYLNIELENVGHTISYSEKNNYFPPQMAAVLKGIYIALLMVPIFVSSLRLMWLFGFLSLASALVAHYFYHEAFTSVWCFFAALLSLILYKIIKINIQK